MDNLLIDNAINTPFPYSLSIDKVVLPELAESQASIDILRLDRLHPVVSGNKWFKLKGWLALAAAQTAAAQNQTRQNEKAQNQTTQNQTNQTPADQNQSTPHILTFGGAWSNHIVATACTGQAAGFKTTGIIRGEHPKTLSHTLETAQSYGMQLEFISRESYRKKDDPAFIHELSQRYPNATIIPEGGAGRPGIEGSRDILNGIDTKKYSHILCAVGTATTFEGLSEATQTTILGISVLKGISYQNPNIITSYHFGGYAKHSEQLLDFMNDFYRKTTIPSDFVYTAKLFYATMDLIKQHYFRSGSNLLVIHSGGLQGNNSLPAGRLIF